MKMMSLTACALALFPLSVWAEEPPTPQTLMIELNTQETVTEGCLLTFLVQNATQQTIDAAVFETVLFDKEGRVDRLTLFDFAELPANKNRIRQFQIAGLACEDMGQVLFNGANTCTANGSDSNVCKNLTLRSRTGVEIGG